jgi:hypothetical protein
LHRRTCSAVSSTTTNARPETEDRIDLFASHAEATVPVLSRNRQLPLTAIAEQIAPRVAATLAGHEQAPTEIEPWRTIGLPEAAERLGRSERWVRERTKDAADPLPFLRLGDGSLARSASTLTTCGRGLAVDGCRPSTRSRSRD